MRDIAARYTDLAATYDSMWSPVIRPMASPVVRALPADATTVLDVGCGTGALFGDVGAAAPGAHLAGMDASEGMLRFARGPVACADAAKLPVAGNAVDAAMAVFMLHHVEHPVAALTEIARVLRSGGLAGTVTWGADTVHEAGTLWDAMLDAAGAEAAPEPVDSRGQMDDDAKAAALLREAGLIVERAWVERPEHRYGADELCTLHTRYGRRNARWLSLPDNERTSTLEEFRALIDARPDLLTWRPQVVYALARRP